MDNNFIELKRLFDGEVKHTAQQFPPRKWELDPDEDEINNLAAAYTIAKLFDGYSISAVSEILKKTENIVRCANKIKSSSVQDLLNSQLNEVDD